MKELIAVDLLRSLAEVFLWETSLKLLTVLSLLGGAAAEWTILRRNEKWWVFPLLLFGAAAILEGLWQLSVGGVWPDLSHLRLFYPADPGGKPVVPDIL